MNLAELQRLADAIGMRYDGVQDGFGSVPSALQFTFTSGPANTATFYAPVGSTEAEIKQRAAAVVARFVKHA